MWDSSLSGAAAATAGAEFPFFSTCHDSVEAEPRTDEETNAEALYIRALVDLGQLTCKGAW